MSCKSCRQNRVERIPAYADLRNGKRPLTRAAAAGECAQWTTDDGHALIQPPGRHGAAAQPTGALLHAGTHLSCRNILTSMELRFWRLERRRTAAAMLDSHRVSPAVDHDVRGWRSARHANASRPLRCASD
ncbi:hypothetical protein MRX96_014279 [Rhipicephalus microplus]